MSRHLAALISLAVVLSGSFTLSTQSAEAKTSRNSTRKARNFFVPPPPPYTPTMSMLPSALDLTYAQVVKVNADGTVVVKMAAQGDIQQVVQPKPHVSYDHAVETKILKHIDSFDSDISSVQKEITKLLNL